MTHPNGLPCGCGGLGCWEQYGSATALIRMTRSAMEASPKSLLWEVCGGSLDRVEGRTPFQAARAGDETALRVLEEYQKELSYGLISLSNILFPEVICLGGGVSSADSDLLLDPVRELVHRGCFDKDRPAQSSAGQPGQRRRRSGRRHAVPDGITFPSKIGSPAGGAFAGPGRFNTEGVRRPSGSGI